MKNKIFVCFLAAVFILIVFSGCNIKTRESTTPTLTRRQLDEKSPFKDHAFEERVREELGIDGNIDLDILSDVTELDLSYKGDLLDNDRKIRSLYGLIFFPNLKKLVLDNNLLPELKGIESCGHLEYLSATGCNIVGIAALYDIPSLKHIDLSKNSIKRTSAFLSMEDLEYLNVEYNEISQDLFLFHKKYDHLKTLKLSGNNIDDLSFVSNCENLEELTLSSMSITDISPLSSLRSLRILDLNNNRITDVGVLAALVELEKLYIDSNEIASFEISSLEKLSLLSIKNNKLVNIECIAGLKNIKYLYLDNNKILDFFPLYSNDYFEITTKNNPVKYNK